jgi:hypothetical protein
MGYTENCAEEIELLATAGADVLQVHKVKHPRLI